MSELIKIDVWSEIACPWCYIGKRRLEAGVTAFTGEHPDVGVEVEFHSFILAPDAPDTEGFDGSEVDFLVQHKGITAGRARQLLEHVTAAAASEGLHYDFDALRHTSTLKAHQVIHYAKAHGRQGQVKERIQRAYFTEGAHTGHDDVLADLAADVGLDRDDVMRSLASQEYLAAVLADHDRGVSLGITGVPFFVLDGRYGISGAQSSAAFVQALKYAATPATRGR